ncbi:hypothetical protein CXG81DRAFT_18071 [Caulochytrium protostelioides]|uniref:Small ribosomal subunit protein uS10 n=1 Tax=Caulochytrium protostelioides TaxID=1555241 RepID=A0A4P9XA49_9FUNG|nr:hypothetical protein CXG81DRAFT_18071 [Caulochytrium protostelioides]|eukprot:RKP02244.1 hypothetical protein CXG81DRAFT_18071 [Caulochytrium protostelioides]
MSVYVPKHKEAAAAAQASKSEVRNIRITLTSCNTKALEKVASVFVTHAKSRSVAVAGPVYLPTKVLKITTRKSPCGNGSKTFDCYEMRIHKRLIDLTGDNETIKKITTLSIEPGVEIEVTIG